MPGEFGNPTTPIIATHQNPRYYAPQISNRELHHLVRHHCPAVQHFEFAVLHTVPTHPDVGLNKQCSPHERKDQ